MSCSTILASQPMTMARAETSRPNRSGPSRSRSGSMACSIQATRRYPRRGTPSAGWSTVSRISDRPSGRVSAERESIAATIASTRARASRPPGSAASMASSTGLWVSAPSVASSSSCSRVGKYR